MPVTQTSSKNKCKTTITRPVAEAYLQNNQVQSQFALEFNAFIAGMATMGSSIKISTDALKFYSEYAVHFSCRPHGI